MFDFLSSRLIPFAGSICNRDVLADMETDGDIIDVDTDFMDPQQCATIACDIYKHLRASEVKRLKFPFLEFQIQFKDITLFSLFNVFGSGKEKAFYRLHGKNSERYKFKYACYTD